MEVIVVRLKTNAGVDDCVLNTEILDALALLVRYDLICFMANAQDRMLSGMRYDYVVTTVIRYEEFNMTSVVYTFT